MQRAVLSLFWQSAWRHKRYVLGILFLLPPTILAHQFLPPLVLSGILNQLAIGDYTRGDLWGSFGRALSLFIVLRFISATFMWRGTLFLTNRLEGFVTTYLNRRVFNHLLSQSTHFHANHLGGSLVAATTRLTAAYIQLSIAVVMQFIPLILSFVYATIILLPRAPLYTLCLLGLTALYLGIAIIGTRKVREKSNAHALAQGVQTGQLSDVLTNILAVKTSATESYERHQFEQITTSTQNKFFDMIRTAQTRELMFNHITASITCISIVLAVAGVVVLGTDITTTFLIIEYTGLLTARLWEFTIGTLRTYNRAIGDASDMVDILGQSPTVQDPPLAKKPRITGGQITLENVTFLHAEQAKPMFSQLSLTIEPGQRVGLVGHSGAGKTSLIKLLMRLDDVAAGTIRIDNQDISSMAQRSLRKNIAYIPQEPLLFHRTIKENIAYGNSRATLKEIKDAAKKAYAVGFIEQLPQKYDTVVGERGVKLSGGQRQRIAIARAILKKAPILILDEATSALDSESEREIQKAIEALMKKRTTIVIAHRLSTIQRLDRIIVFEDGKIIEDGSHAKLLAKNGVYARLWKHQSGGFIQ